MSHRNRDWSNWKVILLTGHAADSSEVLGEITMVSEYGRDSQHKAFSTAFEALKLKEIQHRKVTVKNVDHILDGLSKEDCEKTIVINTCDGTDADGYPGGSVVSMLKKKGMFYTGGDETFFNNTTDKLTIKRLFSQHNVPSAQYVDLSTEWPPSDKILEKLNSFKYPAIVKPSVSYSSCGITSSSIVHNAAAALQQAIHIKKDFGDTYCESFVNGKEFTALTVGDRENGVKVYSVAERVFKKDLKWDQKLLTYERYWGLDLKQGEKLEYWYEPAPKHLQDELKRIAENAYLSVGGRSYSRVDMRMDDESGQIYVLEVNCHCALSTEPDSSMGNILRFEGEDFSTFLNRLFELAVFKSEGKSSSL